MSALQPPDHELDVSLIPEARASVWGTASCSPWVEHFWVRFIERQSGLVVLVLCTVCGRDPAEALGDLPVVTP